MKSLENVFGHHLGQYLANNSAYLNSSQSNHFPLGSSANLDCLTNLNNLSRDFHNHLVPTSSSSLIGGGDFGPDLKSNLHNLGLFSNLSDNNNNSKQLNELNKSLANEEMNDDEDEDDCVSIDVDGADEEPNGGGCEKPNEAKFILNSIEENMQKSLIKSLSINSDATSIKSEPRNELKSDHQSKTNLKAINADEAKALKNPTISSLSSSSSSSSTDAQYGNINSFLYPHWLLSCTQ